MEIIVYHQIDTQSNGKLAHCAHDLESTSQMSLYAPRMSQSLDLQRLHMELIRIRVHGETNI